VRKLLNDKNTLIGIAVLALVLLHLADIINTIKILTGDAVALLPAVIVAVAKRVIARMRGGEEERRKGGRRRKRCVDPSKSVTGSLLMRA
jgi:hypothetical protein